MAGSTIADNIYIIHALKGYEFHEKRIRQLFPELGLKFEFITEGDQAHFSQPLLEKYFTPGFINRTPGGALSCTLNHILACERAVLMKHRYTIILENDPFFIGNFQKKLNRLVTEIGHLDKGFIISLENTTLRFPSFWQIKKQKYLYRAKVSRMAGAYIIDHTGASAILKDLEQNKCDTIVDWWHIDLINRGIIKMFWAHPPLVEQGSHNGKLCSTISSKPKSFRRRISWLCQKFYKSVFKRLFNQYRLIT
jgi:glycosyl transferase family 25